MQQLSPDYLQCDKIIRDVLEESRNSFHKQLNSNLKSGDAATVMEIVKRNGDSYVISTKTSNNNNNNIAHHSYANQVFFWWQFLMGVILISFFISCISHFAQYHQLQVDEAEIKKLKHKLGILTPAHSPTKEGPTSCFNNTFNMTNKSNITSHNNDNNLRDSKDKILRQYGYSTSVSSSLSSPYMSDPSVLLSSVISSVSSASTNNQNINNTSANNTTSSSSNQSVLSHEAQPKKSAQAVAADNKRDAQTSKKKE